MTKLPDTTKTICDNCPAKIDKGVLMNERNEGKWSLILCPKKVTEKLLSLDLGSVKIKDMYERVVENFSSFPVCKHGVRWVP